jgi:hypothetical protein
MIYLSDAGTGGARGTLTLQIFCVSANLFQPGKGRLCPPITTGTPKFFHLPASLLTKYELDTPLIMKTV